MSKEFEIGIYLKIDDSEDGINILDQEEFVLMIKGIKSGKIPQGFNKEECDEVLNAWGGIRQNITLRKLLDGEKVPFMNLDEWQAEND